MARVEAVDFIYLALTSKAAALQTPRMSRFENQSVSIIRTLYTDTGENNSFVTATVHDTALFTRLRTTRFNVEFHI